MLAQLEDFTFYQSFNEDSQCHIIGLSAVSSGQKITIKLPMGTSAYQQIQENATMRAKLLQSLVEELQKRADELHLREIPALIRSVPRQDPVELAANINWQLEGF